jgi:hypothetical protein
MNVKASPIRRAFTIHRPSVANVAMEGYSSKPHRPLGEFSMRKFLAAILAASAIGALTLPAAPARADSAGPAIAAGIGGFALGAIAGGALAQSAPPVVYAPPPPPVRCWTERRPVFDEYGEVIGSRPRRICEQ